MARPKLLSALPEVFQTSAAGSPALQAVLSAADAMLAPVSTVLDQIDIVADPYRAPDHVAAALAWWVDLGWLTAPEPGRGQRLRSTLPTGMGPLRDLIAASAELAAQRGSVGGVTRALELGTGTRGWRLVVEAERCHLTVHLPEGADSVLDAATRIVAAMKPAHITVSFEPAASAAPDTGSSHWPAPPTEVLPVIEPPPHPTSSGSPA